MSTSKVADVSSLKGDPYQLYQSSEEFLRAVTLSVDTQGIFLLSESLIDSIYKLVDSYLFATNNSEDEYTIVVLKIMNTDLYKFYGGEYLVQQWIKKKRIFQTVHSSISKTIHQV